MNIVAGCRGYLPSWLRADQGLVTSRPVPWPRLPVRRSRWFRAGLPA